MIPTSEITLLSRAASAPGSLAEFVSRQHIETSDYDEIGAQLTVFYEVAQGAELAFLRFGVAFWWVEEVFAKLAKTSQPSPKGGRPKKGLADWLKTYAPGIAEPSARRYRDIAKAIAKRLEIEAAHDLGEVLDAGPGDLPPEWQEKRKQMQSMVSGKSVHALQLEFDLRQPTPAEIARSASAGAGGLSAEERAAGKRLAALDDDLNGAGDEEKNAGDGVTSTDPRGRAGQLATKGKNRAPIQHSRNVRDAMTSLVVSLPHVMDEEEAEAYEDFRSQIETKWRKALGLLPPRLLQIGERALRERKAAGKEQG
jgi:hypothetical protein